MGGSNSTDQGTIVVVGRGGVFVNGDSNVVTVTNDDRGCAPVALFRDRDGDGFGSDAPEDLVRAARRCQAMRWRVSGSRAYDRMTYAEAGVRELWAVEVDGRFELDG